jgi:hypothetical protein
VTRDDEEELRERWRAGLAPIAETMEYALRVTGRMPSETRQQRRERAERLAGILHEWGVARRRWLGRDA